MSGRVRIVENESWRRLDASRQDQVETCLRLVAGARLGFVDSLLDSVSEASGASTVFIFPVIIPREETRTVALTRALEKAMPFARPFGLALLLVGEEDLVPDSLLDSFWVEVLDDFYDIAIPTAVVVWAGSPAGVEAFQLAAAVSSLFRELDSLAELGRLTALLGTLESRVDALAADVDEGFASGGRKSGEASGSPPGKHTGPKD